MTWESAYQNPLGFEEIGDNKIPDVQQQAFEEAARARYEYCIKLAKTFKTPHGKEILQTLRKNTIEAATWSASLANAGSGLEKANAHAYAREGQNALIQDIENCIEIANKCKTIDDFYNMINQVSTGTTT